MDRSPPDRDLPLHAVGPWRLHEQVATGGSSSIWRATGPDDAIVAVKLLDAHASGTPAERRRFLRGFKVASILSHPGIARLIEAGEHESRLFVVEEFIDGETLAERLRGGSLAIEEALRILRKCGEILGYAHQSGVVHRDLSPRNLMIDRTGRVVLVDFGIAVRPEGTTQPGSNSLLGTLPYLAPELIRGSPANARSDLYALGAIAYQMFTGSPPFIGTQPEAVMRSHLRTRPASLRTHRPEIDSRLDRTVLRLLAKKPEDRFNNADAFLAALDEACRLPRRAGAGGSNAGAYRPSVRQFPAIRRLAVIPFTAHYEGDADRERAERIARGLAETVAAGLAGLEGLSIIPPVEVSGTSRTTLSDLAARLGTDAIVSAHLAEEGQDARRLSWTLVGLDGAVLEGGRLGGPGATLFALEDALIGALIRALRRPKTAGRLRPADAHEEWYAPFLEALGCLQRTDSVELVERAIRLLEGIRDEGAGGVRVHAALGRAYVRRGETSRDPVWRDRAEASCRIALSLDPLAPDALSTMGSLLVSSGRLDEAIALLQRVLDLDPANVEAMVWLSRAHEMAGDLEVSDRYARAACAERPAYWLVHDRKAVIDFRRGIFADAADGWKRVLELTPDNTHALANLGSALFELGELDESEQSFRAAIERCPSARALEGVGLIHFYRGSPEASMPWFERAVELVPEHSRFWGNLADAQRWSPGQRSRSMDSFDRAIGLVRRDLASNPSDARAWSELAVYLAKREQHAEAQSALQRACQLGASSSPARACAIIVHELAGRREEAIAALEQILATSTSLPFDLRCDPELGDLRACAAGRHLLHPPPASPGPTRTNERTPPWPLQPSP